VHYTVERSSVFQSFPLFSNQFQYIPVFASAFKHNDSISIYPVFPAIAHSSTLQHAPMSSNEFHSVPMNSSEFQLVLAGFTVFQSILIYSFSLACITLEQFVLSLL
jgi:hypothetical protein